jgi:hypothetical protein
MPRDVNDTYTPPTSTAYPAVNGVTLTSADWNALIVDVVAALNSAYPGAYTGGTLGAMQATTSGTSIDFTAIPSTATKITVSFVGVSVSGTSNLLLQIGDAGGIETSGYLGASAGGVNGVAAGVANFTAGFGINSAAAANVLHGAIVLTLVDSSSNTWAAHGTLGLSSAAAFFTTAGSKSLSAALTQVRLTTVNGTDTFDAGSVNILYE